MGMEGNDPTLAQPPGRPAGVGGYDPTVPVERVPDYGGPDGPGGPGGPGGGGNGDGGGDDDDDARRRRILLYSLGGIAAILVIVIIILLVSGGGDDNNKPTSTTSTSTTSTSTTSTSTTSTSTTSSPTTAPPQAPTITSFTNDTPNCQTNQINLHWTTQNAVGVDISIDGPGKYQSYGASGSAQVPFVCGGSHTYLLTAKGSNGSTSQRMITVQSPPVTTTASSTTSTT
jgi:cytoskeletal protein RodZ